MSDFQARLQNFLDQNNQSTVVEQLTPDASTREYYRVHWQNGSAIACVYPEANDPAAAAYADVTELFLSQDLPVAQIYAMDLGSGVVIQEDLGNIILRDVLIEAGSSERESLANAGISLIPRIQAATEAAVIKDSIAAKLRFDTEKLLWELNFFKEHYFTTLRKSPLSADVNSAVEAEFIELSKELEARAAVLCHRDFHAANLMVDRNGRLRIIDHQDARIGSVTYDLVSFLLDRVTEPPPEAWLDEKRTFFLAQRAAVGLPELERKDFEYEFQLQAVQRCLKAVGTFSFQSVNRGKTYFLPYIAPMFRIVLEELEDLDRFPVLRSLLNKETRL